MSSIIYILSILQQTNNLNDSLLFDKGYKRFLNNELVNAEECFLQQIELYPDSPYRQQCLYLLGEIKFKQGKYDEAIEYWGTLKKEYPSSDYKIETTRKIGDAYFNRGKYNFALNAYNEVKNFKPAKGIMLEINLKIDECLYHLGHYKNLTDALYHFIDTNSDTVDLNDIIARTMLRISRIHLEKKEYYSALIMLDRLQETYPRSPIISEMLFERANTYKLLGDNQGYKKVLSQLTIKKDNPIFYTYAIIELADIYFYEQKYDSSLYYWNILSEENKKYSDMALEKIAEIYNKIGRKYEATIVIQSLIDRFPESKYIPDAYLLQAEIFKSQEDLQNTRNILKELQLKSILEPTVLLRMGNIYFEIGDYDSAINIYLLASETFKDQRDESARALLLAGDAAYAKGDKDSARRYYLNARFIAQSQEVKNLAGIKINRLE